MEIHFGKKKLNVDAKEVSIFSTGLMFRSRNTENLLFDLSKSGKADLTSLFVFFPFLAVWLDAGNKVVAREVIRPFRFRISIKKKFSKVLEIPINERNREIVKFLVGGKKV